jgi:methionyl-tRNA formyltransferase
MKIAIITQEDHFVIPQNVEKILVLDDVEVVLMATIDAKGALTNRKSFFARGFGLGQAGHLGWRLMRMKCLDALDGLLAHQLPGRKRSIRAVARKHRIPFSRIADPNAAAFLKRLQGLQVDLVVSLSAPCVFGPELLAVPIHGCINLHCSLLPRFAGLLPSFWVLYHGETVTGATVHYMDSKIDNGSILGQVRVAIEPGTTLFDLIQKTKAAGGDLMVEVIRRIQSGDVEPTPNRAEEGSYFSWPTIDQMRQFRRRGGRFV